MIGQKPLETLNYDTRSIVSVRKIRSNEYNRNIKVVPLGDVNLFMLKTRSLETIFIAICILPKSGVNTCPLFSGRACVPENTLLRIMFKHDVNTPSAMHVEYDNFNHPYAHVCCFFGRASWIIVV